MASEGSNIALANANNHVGVHLYKLLAEEGKNVFFSPFSISTALAMLHCGAQKETAEEMRNVLGYEIANIKDDELKFLDGKFDEKNTFLQYFYNKGDEEEYKQVEMMHLKEKFPYVEKESFKALQLPYKGEDISMIILLPNARDGLEELEKSLSLDFIQDLTKSMRKRKVEVALPKFRLEYSKSLKESFQALGMNRVFNSGAHLNGINDSDQLLVSEILHKAVLIVNEEGSEAAAVTAVMVMMCSLQFDPEFIVDHPFMFAIYNCKNNLILFMGRVDEL
ncbi:uncharacterized serpin-like protein TK1782 [Caerostris darwini]|uniref:Uncharacterized serpin-like protein TK1782 n=1 Tax=Caerostris darwini TaxID=1538125 RepID=A0AAV4SB00_9ARAC|nr:uncharacterized serpin-like protein TK1782 [Caerostris darwini]